MKFMFQLNVNCDFDHDVEKRLSVHFPTGHELFIFQMNTNCDFDHDASVILFHFKMAAHLTQKCSLFPWNYTVIVLLRQYRNYTDISSIQTILPLAEAWCRRYLPPLQIWATQWQLCERRLQRHTSGFTDHEKGVRDDVRWWSHCRADVDSRNIQMKAPHISWSLCTYFQAKMLIVGKVQ